MHVQQFRNKPLTARSVIASTLLGAHPPVLPGRVLVRSGALFGIPPGTIRVALSRMVQKRELVQQDDGRYALAGQLLRRQERQEEGRRPQLLRWDGTWTTALIRSIGRPAAERGVLRSYLQRARLAELRDGVWVRPANLRLDRPPDSPAEDCLWATTRFETGAFSLVTVLWNLRAWGNEARALQSELGKWRRRAARSADVEVLAPGFVLSAAVLRQFNADPLLPRELLPKDWPGRELRDEYEAFNEEFLALWQSFMGRDDEWDH